MNETLPKVSIVLPTYNGAEYIRQSIDSCLNQTYKNIELIIVDDGSTDETPEIVGSYKDERIRYIRHKENNGLPHVLNAGFAKATGEYLTWTSDDNYYAKEAIEKMLSFLKTENCSLIYCDFYRFNDETPFNRNIVKLPDLVTLENKNNIGPCFLYSRKVMEIVGDYDLDTELAEDYDYWMRVSKKFSMRHLAEPLYLYREHGESLSLGFLRQYEIQTVSILVRVKNNLIDAEQATRQFIDLFAQKNMALIYMSLKAVFHLIGFITFNRIGPSKLYGACARFRFSKRINRILKDFQMRRIAFEQAKVCLIEIINRRLSIKRINDYVWDRRNSGE